MANWEETLKAQERQQISNEVREARERYENLRDKVNSLAYQRTTYGHRPHMESFYRAEAGIAWRQYSAAIDRADNAS